MPNFREICNAVGMEYTTDVPTYVMDANPDFIRPAPLDKADSDSFSFCNSDSWLGVANSKAGLVICPQYTPSIEGKVLIKCERPRLAFLRVMREFFNNIKPKITIGKNVIIGEGTVLGVNGFGFERNEKGEIERFPHIGGVTIGDNVEFSSNCSVCRGTLEDTVIGEGTHIDGNTFIGHNCKIGKHCIIVCHVVFNGSVTVGDYAWIGSGTVLRDQVTIGDHACVGIGSVVTKDVPAGVTVYGNPARIHV